MELKWIQIRWHVRCARFNRTFMELKLDNCIVYSENNNSFNRTFMELK